MANLKISDKKVLLSCLIIMGFLIIFLLISAISNSIENLEDKILKMPHYVCHNETITHTLHFYGNSEYSYNETSGIKYSCIYDGKRIYTFSMCVDVRFHYYSETGYYSKWICENLDFDKGFTCLSQENKEVCEIK